MLSYNDVYVYQDWGIDEDSRGPGGSRELPGGVREGPGGFLEGSLSQVEFDIPLGTLLGPFLEPSWSPSGRLTVGRGVRGFIGTVTLGPRRVRFVGVAPCRYSWAFCASVSEKLQHACLHGAVRIEGLTNR